MTNHTLEILEQFKQLYCKPQNLLIKNYKQDVESSEYSACFFILENKFIHFRCAKITPTKIGQFVTFWKRVGDSEIMPYDISDTFDALIVYTKTAMHQGLFIFLKEILLKHDIISHQSKGGKRAMRVYPSWDITENKQAKRTQAWQLQYFKKL